MTTIADTSLTEQEVLLANLQQTDQFPHPVEKFELLQTHISWVLLTGPYAYKFKKPLDLGFLNFSTLALRKHFCEEEVRLNRRFSDELYLDVISITGDINSPQINGPGKVIEYAVKMRQFPQSAQLDVILSKQGLTNNHIDNLADAIAEFHQHAERAGGETHYGDADNILNPVLENFSHIRNIHQLAAYEPQLSRLEDWCRTEFNKLKPLFNKRKQAGFIREGHGDMHLRNMALLDDRVVLFDCLEFNPDLRFIDVMNDLAFLLMDLDDRHQVPYAWRCLNRYLQHSGDYEGLKLLAYYKIYRALVRAKVDAIRLSQPHLTVDEQNKTTQDFLDYVVLAESYIEPGERQLIITRGLSGSGKSTYTQILLEAMGAIRIRSDVERKRSYSEQSNLYNHAVTEQVYQRLLVLAETCLTTGYPVIIDASFLDTQQIWPFHALASRMGMAFHILEFNAKPDTLRTRLKQRQAEYSDATLEVLEKQISKWCSVPEDLQKHLLAIDTEHEINIKELKGQLL